MDWSTAPQPPEKPSAEVPVHIELTPEQRKIVKEKTGRDMHFVEVDDRDGHLTRNMGSMEQIEVTRMACRHADQLNEYDAAQQRIQALERENQALENELAEIRRTSANVLSINDQNTELNTRVTNLGIEVDTLEQQLDSADRSDPRVEISLRARLAYELVRIGHHQQALEHAERAHELLSEAQRQIERRMRRFVHADDGAAP